MNQNDFITGKQYFHKYLGPVQCLGAEANFFLLQDPPPTSLKNADRYLSGERKYITGNKFYLDAALITELKEIFTDGLTPVQRKCKKLWNNSNYVKQNPQRAY